MSGDRLRWAIFTVSVVSSVDNPSAHLWRTFGRRLQQRANVATFFETRGNRAVQALLRRERAGGLNAFRERFSDIHYQTVEPRTGFALAEWLNRMLSTVDIALVDRDASPELIAALSEFSRPFLQTFLIDPGWGAEPIDPTPLANFTGVLAGDDKLVVRYAEAADGARVYGFGPLPADLADPEPTADQSAALEDAVDRAIATILSASEKIRRARGTQIVANGRTDHSEPLLPHEPN
jgi:hypothetical protein